MQILHFVVITIIILIVLLAFIFVLTHLRILMINKINHLKISLKIIVPRLHFVRSTFLAIKSKYLITLNFPIKM